MKASSFIGCGVSVLLLVVATTALSGERDRLRVGTVAFEGNRAFTDSRLQRLMLTRPSVFLRRSYYYEELLDDDLENVLEFYRQNGYLDTQIIGTEILADTVKGVVHIRVSLNEGELTRVEGISVFGNTAFSDSTILQRVNLRKGDPLRRRVIQEGVLSILSMYAEAGYLDAGLTPDIRISTETDLAVVDLILKERRRATIADIRIEGLQKTKQCVVARELHFKKGEVVRYSRLVETQRALYLTGLFESVFVRPVVSETGDSTQKDILIELKEAPSSEFNVAVGYGSVEKIRGRVELFTTNLAGTARQAGTNLEASFIKRGIGASLTDPRTLGTRLRTDLNLSFDYFDEPGYDLRSYGTRLTIGRSFGKQATASLAYRFENGELKNITVVNPPVDRQTRTRSLILSLSYDTRDNLFDSKQGIYLEWSGELAGSFLKGKNTFARSVVRLKWFKPLGMETVVGSALEFGVMDFFGESVDIPLNERFYSGGPTSLRGFGYQLVGPLDENGSPLGGNFKIVWNVGEVRRTLYKMVGGAVFVDVGNVWSSTKDFRIDDLRASSGIGLRIGSPLGIVRLDFSINLDPRNGEPRGKLFLGMGQTF